MALNAGWWPSGELRDGKRHHDALAQRGVQARLGDDVHTAAQQLLRIQQQAAQGQGAGAGREGYQQVHVAAFAGFAAACIATHRAKDPNARDAAPACQGQQFGAVGFDQRMHGRQFSHTVKRARRLRAATAADRA